MLALRLAFAAVMLLAVVAAQPAALACTPNSTSTPVGPLSVDEHSTTCSGPGSSSTSSQTAVVENSTTGITLAAVNGSSGASSYASGGYSSTCEGGSAGAGTGATQSGVTVSESSCTQTIIFGPGSGQQTRHRSGSIVLREGMTGLAVGYEEGDSSYSTIAGNSSWSSENDMRGVFVQDTRGNAIQTLRIGVRHTASDSSETECRESYALVIQGPFYQDVGPGSMRCQGVWDAAASPVGLARDAFALLP